MKNTLQPELYYQIKDRIPDDTWEFDTEEDFLKAINFLCCSESTARESLEHERGHMAKARELGYSPCLAVEIWNNPYSVPHRLICPCTKIRGIIRIDELNIIKSHPDKSIADCYDLQKLEKDLGMPISGIER